MGAIDLQRPDNGIQTQLIEPSRVFEADTFVVRYGE